MTGEREPLGEWVGARYARAYRTAVLICGNPADAEEAVQDAFLRAWRFRDALPTDDRRDAWLYRVLVNACYSKLRKEVPRRDRERERLDPDGGPLVPADSSPEVRAERSAVAELLTSSLADLPESLRVVVVLRYYADLSEREIAIAIRRRPGTVKSRLHEARRRLAADAAAGRLRVRRFRLASGDTMIDELVLERLFTETAEEIPTPDNGMTRVIDEIERSAHRTHRASVARPVRVFATVAAGVAVLAGIGVLLSGNSQSAKSGSSFTEAAAPKSLQSNGSSSSDEQFLRQRAARHTAVPPTGAGGNTTQSTPVDGAKIVKTGTLDLQVAHDTLRTAVNRVSGIAVGLDGYIANSTTNYDGADPTGQITMRVPVDNFEAAVKQLKALPGVKVLGDSETGKDVTAQYVDLQAQLTARQTELGALNTILAGAESIPDTLAVRDRMTAVQAEINQLQGQINVLADKSTYSAIAVTLAEKSVTATAKASTPPTGLSKAWKDARDGFSNSLEWIIARSGGALIVLLAGLLLLFGLRYLYPVVRRALL